MTTGKTMALTIQTFVSKVMSLLFNTLSFSYKEQAWLQSPSAVIIQIVYLLSTQLYWILNRHGDFSSVFPPFLAAQHLDPHFIWGLYQVVQVSMEDKVLPHSTWTKKAKYVYFPLNPGARVVSCVWLLFFLFQSFFFLKDSFFGEKKWTWENKYISFPSPSTQHSE